MIYKHLPAIGSQYLLTKNFLPTTVGEIPIQEKSDDYNCGVYVLHYGYAIVRWYDRYRSNITPNRNNITVLDFLSNFCNSAILLTTNDGKEHMNNLRHQISALVCSLHKHHDTTHHHCAMA